jgi:anti-sigma regulatory factor (Ser/Thr protein kinase)
VTVAQDQTTLQHDGIFYDDEAVFTSAAISFVREGVARDEVVLVNTGTNAVTSLLRAVFAADEQVTFADRPVYRTPAGALDGYRRAMDRGLADGARGFRAMGFIDFDSSNLPWQEWLRYEAAVNHVFEGYPFRTLCPYDTTQVEEDVVAAIAKAHPGLVDAAGRRANLDYIPPAELITDQALRTPPLPVQEMAPRMVLEPDHDADHLRLELFNATMFTHLPRGQVDDFVSAVSELVHNAQRHGRDPVTLTLWASDTAVVSTVTDRGPGIEDPLVGYARPTDPAQGLGLWGARQLVDVLDFERSESGFTVRAAAFA